MLVRFILVFILGGMFSFQAGAVEGSFSNESSPVKIELLQEEETVQPGHPFWVALHLKQESGWHVYWKNPGDAGIPLQIEWVLPEGFKEGPAQWPCPQKFNVSEMEGFGYEGDVYFLKQIIPSKNLQPGGKIQMSALVKWLVCSADNCQPGSGESFLPLTISSESPKLDPHLSDIYKYARQKIPQPFSELTAIKKDGLVQFKIPKNAVQGTVQSVFFFPENKDSIDTSVAPLLTQNEDCYVVDLMEGSLGTQSQGLKGVLILKEEKNKIALNIDASFQQEASQGTLALLDPAELSSKAPQSAENDFDFQGGVGLAILLAFMGGMFLNLMPCVLPVISFKVMSFVKMAGQSRTLSLKHGLMFSLGVLFSFWLLASAMLILRAYGQSVGWGFQLQEPLFVALLSAFLFLFALSLFGVFEWGLIFASWAGQAQSDQAGESSKFAGSFFSGIVATAVATPCTGPFLGSAVGFAVTLPVFQSLLIFTSLALGMCFPYLLLSAFPSWLRFLPKPGAWMENFKQLMGFLLLATVLWLLWVFGSQTNTFSLICLVAGLFSFSIGAWVYGKGCSFSSKKRTRLLALAFVALFAFIGFEAILLPRPTWTSHEQEVAVGNEWAGWETFSPERVAELQAEGKPVFIDFTAKWCLICQVNHLLLSSKDMQKQLNDSGVVKMKADWTKNDPIITEALSKFGRNSVPLYVLYGSDTKKSPVILPQVLTPEIVTDHLKQAVPNAL